MLIWVALRGRVALVTSGLRGPLINPASSFRSHQGFASFPLIVDPSDVPSTWVMRGLAWNNQPSRGLKCPNRVRAAKRSTYAVDALRSSVAMQAQSLTGTRYGREGQQAKFLLRGTLYREAGDPEK